MQMNAANIAAVATVMAVVITLLGILGSGIYQMGQLSNEVEHLSGQIEEIREEVRSSNQELREEIHRGNQLLFHALANHAHDENGDAIFKVPVGSEPTGSNR